ncbi:hypothetical protein SOPP22_04220 [Shewanella sp. OPT22]|nr:hypothetical protein SOPP22_04220 [Shewanella sp. OPT22]
MSLDMMRFARPEFKTYDPARTGSIQFKVQKPSLGKNHYDCKPSSASSVPSFHKSQSSNPFRLLKGLAKWLLATLKQECNAGISDEIADEIATERLKKCSNNGEALFLNFQGGAHAAMIVKTSSGYAFLSFNNGSEKCSDVKAENETLSKEEKQENETSIRKRLKAEIRKYRDRTIQQENHIKIPKAQTGRMISKFNEIKSKGYKVLGQNCAHTAMQVLEAGQHSQLKLKQCKITASMCFPSDAMDYAQQVSSKTQELLPKLEKEQAELELLCQQEQAQKAKDSEEFRKQQQQDFLATLVPGSKMNWQRARQLKNLTEKQK